MRRTSGRDIASRGRALPPRSLRWTGVLTSCGTKSLPVSPRSGPAGPGPALCPGGQRRAGSGRGEERKAPAVRSTPTRSAQCGLPIRALASGSPPFPTRGSAEIAKASPSPVFIMKNNQSRGSDLRFNFQSFDIWIPCLWRGRSVGANT